jgi:hypothetical protein
VTPHAPAGNGYWVPRSEEDRRAVQEQLERVLNTPQFSISRRYPSLLRYVVEQTLEGHTDRLKERTLGVEVFGRDPAYDSNADPVVRMTAAQVRRRLTEYYLEPGHATEVRIELPLGAYMPVFRQPEAQEPLATVAVLAVGEPEMVPERLPRRRLGYLMAVVLVVALGATAYFAVIAPMRETALEKFWGPVWDSSNSVLICVGGGMASGANATQSGDPQSFVTIRDMLVQNRVAWADALTFSKLASFITVNGKTPIARRARETSFADLRAAPAVLIGGFNNQWIMRLTGQLRFSYEGDRAAGLFWIQDRENPSRRSWIVDTSIPDAAFAEDYGIIMRYSDPTTERVTVVASGIMYYGTMAAGEFLTNPKYMDLVEAHAPKAWQRKNLEVVFSTKIINGETGAPHILATYFW